MQRNKVVIFIIGESYGSHSVHTFNQTKHSLPLEILLCVWPSGVGFGTNFLQDPPSDMADIFFKGVGTNVNNGYYCFNHYEPENFGRKLLQWWHLCVAYLLLPLGLFVCLFVSFFVGAYGPFMVSFGYTCGCLQTAPTLHCLPTILEPMGSGATFSLSFSLIVFIWVISKIDILHAFSI
jgi:hypothetical protein